MLSSSRVLITVIIVNLNHSQAIELEKRLKAFFRVRIALFRFPSSS